MGKVTSLANSNQIVNADNVRKLAEVLGVPIPLDALPAVVDQLELVFQELARVPDDLVAELEPACSMPIPWGLA